MKAGDRVKLLKEEYDDIPQGDFGTIITVHESEGYRLWPYDVLFDNCSKDGPMLCSASEIEIVGE
jgi:hypothetical protein